MSIPTMKPFLFSNLPETPSLEKPKTTTGKDKREMCKMGKTEKLR
jgi:hypothetical protein